MKGEDRREAILEAARAVYIKLGRDRFSMQAVAGEAGCSIGTLYRYYKDRVALLNAAMPQKSAEDVLSRVRAILTHELPAVTTSRERDRRVLMEHAVKIIDQFSSGAE